MAQEKWLEAHRACLEILRFDPENIKIIRLKNRIEGVVKKINQKAVKSDLARLQPLWKEKKFDELLNQLNKLEPYTADYPALSKIIVKAQLLYKKEVAQQQEEYVKNELNNIKQLASVKKYPDAVKLAEKLRTIAMNEAELKRILKDLRTKWLDFEIEKNKGLLESQKYEDILLFYQGLYGIDGKSPKVKKLIEKAKNNYQIYKIQQKQDLMYKGLEKIKTLIQLKKYGAAADIAEEILDIDPSNKQAKEYFLKAKKKAEKKLDSELQEQLKKSNKLIRDEYKKDKKAFIKI
jgi:hypothetical protein